VIRSKAVSLTGLSLIIMIGLGYQLLFVLVHQLKIVHCLINQQLVEKEEVRKFVKKNRIEEGSTWHWSCKKETRRLSLEGDMEGDERPLILAYRSNILNTRSDED